MDVSYPLVHYPQIRVRNSVQVSRVNGRERKCLNPPPLSPRVHINRKLEVGPGARWSDKGHQYSN